MSISEINSDTLKLRLQEKRQKRDELLAKLVLQCRVRLMDSEGIVALAAQLTSAQCAVQQTEAALRGKE
jgi:hypothetical protein